MARIDRLDVACRRVLQLASVIGRTFSYPLLEAVIGADAPGARGETLDASLLTLQRAQR